MVGLKDVAKKANVSISTVSRFINKIGKTDPEIAKRISGIIKELQYKPNIIARGLKIKSTKTIGVIFPEIDYPFFSGIIKNAEKVAHKNDYNIILCNTDDNPEKERMYIETLKKRFVDGFLINHSRSENFYTLSEVLKDEKVVFVDRFPKLKNAICVKLDNIGGITTGVEYLISLGHKRIGVIHGPLNISTDSERLEAYKMTLKKHKIQIDKTIIQASDYSVFNGYEKTLKLLQMENRPTAILPMCGKLSIGALHAIREMNLKIPDDISIISFDNSNYTALIDPPITTLEQPVCEFGKISMETLIKLIHGEKIEKKKIELKPEFLIKHSCKDITEKSYAITGT